jgi:hypothetical protein
VLSRHPEGSLLWHDRPDTPHTIVNAPPRGPCAGDIDQPPLAPSAVHREVPALAESTSHLSADRTTETVTVVAPGTRWHPPLHQRGLRRLWRFAPLASCPLVLRPLGATPPWCFAPLGLRPDVRLRPVTRGAQPVGLLDKAVKRTPLVLLHPEEDDEDNPRPELQPEALNQPLTEESRRSRLHRQPWTRHRQVLRRPARQTR